MLWDFLQWLGGILVPAPDPEDLGAEGFPDG